MPGDFCFSRFLPPYLFDNFSRKLLIGPSFSNHVLDEIAKTAFYIRTRARALTYIIITYEKKFAIQLFGSSSSAIEPRVRTFCPRMVCVRALCRHSAAGGILNARKHLDVPEKSTDIKADYHHHHHQPVVSSRKLYESRIEKKPSRRVTNRGRLARVFCF